MVDFDEYVTTVLIKQRHAELAAQARREAVARMVTGPHLPMRIRLGTLFVRLGAWLLREEYAK